MTYKIFAFYSFFFTIICIVQSFDLEDSSVFQKLVQRNTYEDINEFTGLSDVLANLVSIDNTDPVLISDFANNWQVCTYFCKTGENCENIFLFNILQIIAKQKWKSECLKKKLQQIAEAQLFCQQNL